MPSDEDLPRELVALARAAGVATSYVDHGGTRRRARREPLVAVLEALGWRAGTDPAGSITELRSSEASQLLGPVTVVITGRSATIDVRRCEDDAVDCELRAEDGAVRSWRARTRIARGRGGRPSAGVELPADLAVGYYELAVRTSAGTGTSHVIVRPPHGGAGRFGASWRASGIAAPLFTLHRDAGWGCGDLADLDRLGELVEPSGVTVIATLPLLAGLEPPRFEPSPYLPISRRFWHERWIDLDDLLHRAGSRLRAVADGARVFALDAASRADPYVDGAASLLAKRRVLRGILDTAESSDLVAELDGYLLDRPDVVDFARFLVEAERLGPDWWHWPTSQRDGQLDLDLDGTSLRYHGFVQLVMERQLASLASRLDARGQVLGLDLPLGVHPWAYDVWRHRDQFVPELSIGAPPDRFFPSGQNWGIPFPNVRAARGDGHTLFRDALRHHLGVARLLRIDHVLGLQRLFCIPPGGTARDGVYVACPLDELLAVVAVEVHRSRAEIVGEDLGTADAGVRRAMKRDGIRRSFVVELAIKNRGPGILRPVPAGSNASFTTHDLATFAGWWSDRDIDERVSTGQVDATTAKAMHDKRRRERTRLSKLVPHRGGRVDGTPPQEVLDAALDVLGRSDAGIVVAQLDDLAGQLDAVNLPGTSTERPNWQRRLRLSMDALARDGGTTSHLRALDAARAHAAPPSRRRRRGDVLSVPEGSRLTDEDVDRFRAGRHRRLHELLGAHPGVLDGVEGTHFGVWAPRAAWVEVVGDVNGWDGRCHPLFARDDTGIFEGFVPGASAGQRYRFRLAPRGGRPFEKADPFAARTELPRSWASVIGEPSYEFGDQDWMAQRAAVQDRDRPISIYEVHLGSWRRPARADRPVTYREIAPLLIEHARRHSFTHVELLPVMEHPLFASWGYQITSYFAPTARYGTPEEFAFLVDELHRAGIGVLLDWAPAHFPADDLALACFDGSPLFEHTDPRRRVHPEWQSLIFDYARGEVRSFLLSSASCWIDRYHADGLRFDAVASMLYLDYARGPGEWEPNAEGGREDLDAVTFLQACNEELHLAHPGVVTMAEESTAWPGVTAPVEQGGLGFDYKWDLGWMHDTLHYLAIEPENRHFHQNLITFRSVYALSEQFVLPLSHDEVVHGKGSLLARMPGHGDERYASLRLLFGFQLAQPGKKLLFMGDELAQGREWAHDGSIEWQLLEEPLHKGMDQFVIALGQIYAAHPALHRDDLSDRGFRWIRADDRDHCAFCIERHDDKGDVVVLAFNAGPTPLSSYEVAMPAPGRWALELSSDDPAFGGAGFPVPVEVTATAGSAALEVPALGFVVYRLEENAGGDGSRSGRFDLP